MVHLHGATIDLGLALLACSVVATVGFVLHQRRGAKPLMALGLFGHRVFTLGGTVAFIYGMALFGSTYLVPVFMQEALHLPPSQAGAVLLPAGLVLAVTIPIAGRLADRIAVSTMVSLGLVLLAASFYLMLGVGPATSLAIITAWAVVGRLGLGLIMPSLNLGAMLGLPQGLISHGSSTINFLRQLGGAVGIGVVGNVLEWRLRANAATPIAAYHETFALIGTITAAAIVAAWRMTPPRPTPQPAGPS
jgi:predicted MFS family arabinose efflux permease